MRLDVRRFAFLIVLFPCRFVLADATFTNRVVLEEPRTHGRTEVIHERKIKGRRCRDEGQFLSTGGALGKDFQGHTYVAQTDLPAGLLRTWELSSRQFNEVRLETARMPVQTSSTSASGTAEAADVPSADARIIATTETKTMNGFACRRYRVNMKVTSAGPSGKKASRVRIESDLWTTSEPKALVAMKEEEAFSKAYLEQVGTGLSWKSPGFQKLLFADSGDLLRRELKKIEGYPVLISTRLYEEAGPAEDQAVAPLVLQSTSELLSVSTKAISVDAFEAPKGFTRAKN